MRKSIVISSKFNIMTGERNQCYSRNEATRFNREWIENRIDIFINYTLKCLKGQTNQNFIAIYVIEDSTDIIINETLAKYEVLPANIRFIKKSDYVKEIDIIRDNCDLFYLTRLDSDDLYCKDFVQKLHDYPIKEGTQELLCQNGYIYDCKNNRLAEYHHDMFTFFTFIYRVYKEQIRYDSLPITPTDILLNFPHGDTVKYQYEPLEGRNFIFNIHGGNTDSTFGVYNWGFARVERMIDDIQEKNSILEKFI